MQSGQRITIKSGPHAGKHGTVAGVALAADLYGAASKRPEDAKIVQVQLDDEQRTRPGHARNFEEAQCQPN